MGGDGCEQRHGLEIRRKKQEAPAFSAGAAGKREYAALALHKQQEAEIGAHEHKVCPP